MQSSEFDALMCDADEILLDRFGTALQLIPLPGADLQPIQVDIEEGLTLQVLGDRGRIGNTERQQHLILATMHLRQVPADLRRARLLWQDKRYQLVEPQPKGDMVEFILLLETDLTKNGSKSSTFL